MSKETLKLVTSKDQAPIAHAEVNDKSGFWVAIIALAISCLSLGVCFTAIEKSRVAERESRLQRLEVDELKVALQVQGIKIHEGSTP